MDLSFLAHADQATFKLETARAALEAAKAAFESAKLAHEEILTQADTHGIPKAKLKKLTEDRVLALFESGLICAAPKESKPEQKRAKKPKAEADALAAEEEELDKIFASPAEEAPEMRM